VRLDDVDDSLTGCWGHVKANDEVLFKFRKIAGTVPKVNVGANIGEGFEFEDAVVNIVAIIHGNITINRLGTPYFRRYFDDKDRRGRQGRRQSRSGREGKSRGEGERGIKRS
jgi:hypothetical protein